MTFTRQLEENYIVGLRLLHMYPQKHPSIVTDTTFPYSPNTWRAAAKKEFQIGHEIAGFKVTEVRDIPELFLTAVRLQHLATGSDYLHIARDDANNVFCVGFRTTPMDSTGVPHILEHTVLCGSEKYAVRDPFFKMLNRSLSTFMNAMTGSDYTIYPFSTQHPVDFRNLMSVYLDAVFKPNLIELDFLQEGWRFEHQDVDDKTSPIVFKGVVFNEMKGVFADSQQLFMQKLQNGLLPSHTYGVVSGGDPLCILDLTWQQLRDFHAYHYHPSNARFYTYGDQPLVGHLEYINENYLKHFKKIDPNTEVPDEPRWSSPLRAHINCGVDPMAQGQVQTSLTVSYMLTNIHDTFETFVLQILGELLMSGPNAPFYKSLLESQLGSQFSPSSGFDSHTRNTTFTVGLQGMKAEDVENVIDIIDQTFDNIIKEGFPKDRIEAVLHGIELSLKHQSSNFGLGVAMALTPLWNHGGDPTDALEFNKSLSRLKQSLEDNPQFLQDKLVEYFKNNAHKYILTMSPKEGYEEELQNAEETLLEKRVNNLSDSDRQNIWEIGQILASKQNEEEDLSSLPTLRVEDIRREVEPTKVEDLKLGGGTPVQVCLQPTNGITYFNMVLNTKDVPDNLRPMIPVLTGVLTKMGAGELDFRSFDQEADLCSGGLNCGSHIAVDPIENQRYEQGIVLSSHCLNHNLPRLLELWTKVYNEVRLNDLQRFTTLVKMIATNQANSLVYSGHRYAMSAAASSTSYALFLKECWSGLSFIHQMKQISECEDLGATLEQLQELGNLLLSRDNMRVSVNTTAEFQNTALSQLEDFLGQISGTPNATNSSLIYSPESFTPHTSRIHNVFPFPINFSSKSYAGVPYCHPDAGPLRVLARVMFRFLHREIREKGGAYGGGAQFAPGGSFSFYSYRDPQSLQTLATFDAAVEWILSGGFNERDVAEAKLGVFQSVDSPTSPGSKGERRFLNHITDEIFSDHRRSILDTAPEDLVRVARVYLKDSMVEGACLIGPANEHLAKDPFWITKEN
ncbi:unnamed protein product, partial [Meganyctiphanes norvegica]